LAIVVGCLILTISLIFIKSNMHGASSEAYGDASSEVAPPTTEVGIGTQTWMTYNLDVTNFRNGEEIPEVKSAEQWAAAGEKQQAAWCYYDNDASNGAKYGKLYNWYAVNDPRGLAPEGWHMPTDQEWTVLSTFLGGDDVAGENMKSSSGWSDTGNGNNSNGFSGLPGGNRDYYGNFSPVGSIGNWWSASEYDFKEAIAGDPNGAWNRFLPNDGNSNLYRGLTNKNNGFSVRCVRD
jgi:uncharacterized protein (TIGR02145 family)